MKVKIQKIEEYPNCRKITVSTTVDGKNATERFSASPEQYETGVWKRAVEKWAKGLKAKPKKVKEEKEFEV